MLILCFLPIWTGNWSPSSSSSMQLCGRRGMPEICRRKRKNAIGGCSKGVCWVRISSSDAEIVTLMRPKTGILLLFCCALCFANWRSSPSLCLGVGTFCVNEPTQPHLPEHQHSVISRSLRFAWRSSHGRPLEWSSSQRSIKTWFTTGRAVAFGLQVRTPAWHACYSHRFSGLCDFDTPLTFWDIDPFWLIRARFGLSFYHCVQDQGGVWISGGHCLVDARRAPNLDPSRRSEETQPDRSYVILSLQSRLNSSFCSCMIVWVCFWG